MSWQDRITREIRITTADGTVYDFLWKSAEKEVEWHSAEFQYINIRDTFVDKRLLLGRRFPLEMYIQGEDHIEIAEEFEQKLDSKEPITIDHPYYNNILAHIVKIKFDHREGNVTRINCDAIETMPKNLPRLVNLPVYALETKKATLDQLAEIELADPVITDIQNMDTVNNSSYNEGLKIITLSDDFQTINNAFNTASASVNNLVASPLLAMRATISLLNAPYRFTATVQNRISALLTTYNTLRLTINGLLNPSSKAIFGSSSAALISSMCTAAANPQDKDYRNSTDVLDVLDSIFTAYKLFRSDIDSIAGPTGSDPTYYIPGADMLNLLDEIVKITISNLMSIAMNGRTERSVVLSDDSNVILLVHKYYGLDTDDTALQEFIDQNTLTYREVAEGIRKGKTITYFK